MILATVKFGATFMPKKRRNITADEANYAQLVCKHGHAGQWPPTSAYGLEGRYCKLCRSAKSAWYARMISLAKGDLVWQKV